MRETSSSTFSDKQDWLLNFKNRNTAENQELRKDSFN